MLGRFTLQRGKGRVYYYATIISITIIIITVKIDKRATREAKLTDANRRIR